MTLMPWARKLGEDSAVQGESGLGYDRNNPPSAGMAKWHKVAGTLSVTVEETEWSKGRKSKG